MPWFSKSKRKSKTRIVKKRRFTNPEYLIFLFKKIGLVVALIVFLIWAGTWFFMSNAASKTYQWGQEKLYHISADSGFVLKNINVTGRINTSARDIKNAVVIQKDEPIFEFNAEETKKRLMEQEWIEDVSVQRMLPDSIIIEIKERVPMAIWQDNKHFHLIDESGIQITDKDIKRFSDLVIIVGEGAPQNAPRLFSYFTALPDIFYTIETARFISNRRWDVTLKNGTLIKLPEDNIPLSLSALDKMNKEEGVLQKKIDYIDLRNLERIIIKSNDDAPDEYNPTVGDAI